MKHVVPLIALLLTGLPSLSFGQRVGGVVRARDTGDPVASAMVQLIARDSTVLRSVLSDSSGRFVLPSNDCPPRDGYLYVARLGYRSLRAPITDLPEDCGAWSITLETEAVALPAVVGSAAPRNRDLERAGFYMRRQTGLGTFVDREQIETRYSTQNQAAEMIARIPNVYRVEQEKNTAMVFLRPAPRASGRPCPAVFYIDGLFYGNALPHMPAMDIEAIEIYRDAAQVPAQFGGANAACGVILIWTRTGAGR